MGEEAEPDEVTPTCSCACHDSSTSLSRSIKRKLDPTALLSSESFKSTASASTSFARVGPSESEIDQLKETIKAQEAKIQSLCDELDEERNASATAANETMAMILKLQGEKAAAQMEARQFKRFADERIAHDDGELEDLEEEIKTRDGTIAGLSLQIETYRERLKRHGIEPDDESDDDERRVVEQAQDDISSEPVYNKYAIYQNGMDDTDVDMNMRQIFMRLEALETAKENSRRDVVAMRTEKMQLVLLRDIARRLCAQVAADRRMVNKPNGNKSSVLGVFKWAFSVFFKRSKSRGLFGLKHSSISFFLLLGLSTRLGRSKTLPKAKW